MGGKRIEGKGNRKKAQKAVIREPVADKADDRYLVWRFGRLDHDTDFGCQNLVYEAVQDLEAELVDFQDETIASLRSKRWLKFVPASDMSIDGQAALKAVSKSQEDGLWQLHLKRYKWRVWGFFEDPKFFFLFWDVDHRIATGQSRHRKN